MIETLLILPVAFWVVIVLLVAGALSAVLKIPEGLGIPMIAVLGTVAAWYAGDALYNDYATNHSLVFTSNVLEAAWWEVAWFITVFLVLAPVLHRWMNAGELSRPSKIFTMLRLGVDEPEFQIQLNQLFWGCISVWLILVLIATIRLGSEIPYYFSPFLGYKADPWGRGQIGGGISALLSLAAYFQMFLAVIFGVVAALAQDERVRRMAMVLCVVTWPYYIFDRIRNNILAVIMPALLSWVFLRLRVSILVKIGILAGSFLLVSVWFDFVIANRSNTSIAAAINGEGVGIKEASQEAHHEGLNMYEELCWINTFLERGTYRPNWGERYFAEIVNPVPRVLWPGKPMIGLDYSVARGQEYTESGTTATVATGMIGQGVVNFGRILGPAFAAFLMSIWAAMLARLDLQGEKIGRIPLFALGLILTFNLGRDITFITLYTFAFGSMIVWWLGRGVSPRLLMADMGEVSVTNRSTKMERRRAVHIARRTGENNQFDQSLQMAAPYSVTTPKQNKKAEDGREEEG